MRFSVIVPLYNCEAYIFSCIDSMLKQSYTDFEVIVVNDGSTDHSLQIVQEISSQKVRCVTQENKGLFHARITGLREAAGDICLFLDADDKLNSNTLDTLNTFFEKGYECVMYKTAEFYNEDEETLIETKGLYSDGTDFQGEDIWQLIRLRLTSAKINSIACKAFKRHLVDTAELGQYPRISIGEDALFTLEVFRNMKSAVYLDRPLYEYRQQPGSLSHNLSADIYFHNLYRTKKYFLFLESALFEEEEKPEIRKRMESQTFKNISSMALNPRYRVPSYEKYKEIMLAIAEDEYFNTSMKRCVWVQNVFFQFVVFCLSHRWVRILYLMRKVLCITGTHMRKRGSEPR